MEPTINGKPVHVDVSGEGPPLVLVHSLLTDAAAFDRIVPGLGRHRTVWRVSLPGFGGTPTLPEASIDDLADFLAETMSGLGLGGDSAVLGNGLGGFVAVGLATRHGERFDRLIASNCGAAFSSERAAAFHTMSQLVEEGGIEAVVEVAIRRIFPARYLEAHPDEVEARRRALLNVDPEAFATACRALASLDLRPRLASIRNPTLVVVGADDETTPPEMGVQLRAGIPGAGLVVLPDCGHCPQLQQPQALVAAIESFLSA